MKEIKHTEDLNEEKTTLDKIQEWFYEKRSDLENYILKMFFATLALMTFALLTGNLLNSLFAYLSLPFVISLFVTAISALTYFLVSLYFWKRKTEKYLEKPKTFKEKCFKFIYGSIKFLIGFGFVWSLAGNSILSLIFDRPIQAIGEDYNQTAIKLALYAFLLGLTYCAIIIFSFSAQLVGFGDKISKGESVFNLASKRSFVMFLGGFFVCLTLLGVSTILDNKISIALTKAADKVAQSKKDYQNLR
jgi:hypothetical protein